MFSVDSLNTRWTQLGTKHERWPKTGTCKAGTADMESIVDTGIADILHTRSAVRFAELGTLGRDCSDLVD